jgi:hypothetical protein
MKEKIMANVKTELSPADAELVRDCEAEAADACSGDEAESLCSLARDNLNYLPYSDDVTDNILQRLATAVIGDIWPDCIRQVYARRVDGLPAAATIEAAIIANWADCIRHVYATRVEKIFGSVSQRAVEFLEQELIDAGA